MRIAVLVQDVACAAQISAWVGDEGYIGQRMSLDTLIASDVPYPIVICDADALPAVRDHVAESTHLVAVLADEALLGIGTATELRQPLRRRAVLDAIRQRATDSPSA